ncbi:Alpha-2-macroglobulin, N-terminal domain-containing protein [Strongyloides ratti]|uniref:Alpha-2-macroglobulin, N-terminal domain-containing protein n=1 Tax=Strongyloides ratti TaxID=34506 RepID=A0A090MUV5_STRRB|nr:Alpha-2-macroglobulin, N-terminal domain-containing protein [Strongyloides ratti]CEF62463.1 Alpha-2-macroglobulin, N-terminal domain-containing protein [Strongyloides ratti]
MSFGVYYTQFFVAVDCSIFKYNFFIVAPDFIPWDETAKFIVLPGWDLNDEVHYLTYSIYSGENNDILLRNSSIPLSNKQLLTVSITNLPIFDLYFFIFDIKNKKKEEFKIYGGNSIKHIYIQSDKKIYRPSEKVKIVALPIKINGNLYNKPLTFSILDSRNVKIIIQKIYYSWEKNFYHYEFELPKFNCTGRWTILVHPSSSYKILSHHFKTTIYVQDYILPLYNFFMDVKSTDDEWIYEVTTIARHSIGKDAIGNIEIEGICDNNHSNTLIGPDFFNLSL